MDRFGFSARGLLPAAFALVALCLVLGACSRGGTEASAIGDAARGRTLVTSLGCGSCHTVSGVEGAKGKVGPPLSNMGERTVIAGVLPNTPANMIVWLKSPQGVIPNNVMPDIGLSDRDARDIAAYLSTLRRG